MFEDWRDGLVVQSTYFSDRGAVQFLTSASGDTHQAVTPAPGDSIASLASVVTEDRHISVHFDGFSFGQPAHKKITHYENKRSFH